MTVTGIFSKQKHTQIKNLQVMPRPPAVCLEQLNERRFRARSTDVTHSIALECKPIKA